MRKNRQLLEGAEYHVTARINRGENIFLAREDRELFMSILKRAKKKFNFSLKNFCIMGNHIHLLIKPGPENLFQKSCSGFWEYLLKHGIKSMAYPVICGETDFFPE